MTPEERQAHRKRERAEIKRAADRALYLQCDRCKATATGRVTRSGVLVSQGFKVEYGRHTTCSSGRCGGRVRLIDIATDDAA